MTAASCLTVVEANSGQGFIHKAKLNNNGSFSVGKTWRLAELRGLEVLNVSIQIHGECIGSYSNCERHLASRVQHHHGTDISMAN